MRFPDTGQTHDHDERRATVRRPRDRGDLRAKLVRELIGVLRVGPCLSRRGRPPVHAPNPRAFSASRAVVASSYGRFSSPTMIEPS